MEEERLSCVILKKLIYTTIFAGAVSAQTACSEMKSHDLNLIPLTSNLAAQHDADWKKVFVGEMLAAISRHGNSNQLSIPSAEIFLRDPVKADLPLVDKDAVYITPVRLLAMVHAIRAGADPIKSTNVHYLHSDEFNQMAKSYFRAFKDGVDYQPPAEFAFLLPIFQSAPKTDFVPFEMGASQALVKCVVESSPALSPIVAFGKTKESDRDLNALARAVTRVSKPC